MADQHKTHVCVFCKKSEKRIHRHFMRKHKTEEKVRQILSIKDKKLKLWGWKKLKQEGDFEYNEQTADKAEEKLTVRKPMRYSSRKKHFTCMNCFGRLRTKSRNKHIRSCSASLDASTSGGRGINSMDICEGMPENVINRVRRSELLHSFVTAMFMEKGAEHKNTITTPVSDLLSLELELQGKLALINFIVPNQADNFVVSMRKLCG